MNENPQTNEKQPITYNSTRAVKLQAPIKSETKLKRKTNKLEKSIITLGIIGVPIVTVLAWWISMSVCTRGDCGVEGIGVFMYVSIYMSIGFSIIGVLCSLGFLINKSRINDSKSRSELIASSLLIVLSPTVALPWVVVSYILMIMFAIFVAHP